MMSKELQAAFNDQVQLEFSSAYTYLAMAAWCESHDLTGFGGWMREQAREESGHALRFFDFLLSRDAAVALQALPAPASEFASALDVFQHALAHERQVSEAIGQLYARASDEGDYASLPLLHWFMGEQVEEEATVRQIVAELRMVADDSSALLLLDREMPGRRDRLPGDD